jgi:hypothetical protein
LAVEREAVEFEVAAAEQEVLFFIQQETHYK